MKKTLCRYEKQIGSVRVAIIEEKVEGRVSRDITFTRRQFDGTEAPTFSDEGDLAQLNTAVWRAQEWLNQHPADEAAVNEAVL